MAPKKSKKNNRPKSKKSANKTSGEKTVNHTGNGVILLNKAFSGSWLDAEGHIAHEIIDFLRADDGNVYVYDAPHGSAHDVYVNGQTPAPDEKFCAQYMVITGGYGESKKEGHKAGACSFDIQFVIKLAKKIHPFHSSYSWRTLWAKKDNMNQEEKDLGGVIFEEFFKPGIKTLSRKDIKKKLVDLFRRTSLDDDKKEKISTWLFEALHRYQIACDNHNELVERTRDITFGGKTLEEIYTEQGCECSLFITFLAERGGIYIANKPFTFPCLEYNQQRCRGRLKESKNTNDYNELIKWIEDELGKSLKPFCSHKLERIAKKKHFKERLQQETFLGLLDLQNYEQAFTNMLYTVLKSSNGDMLKRFCTFICNRYIKEGKSLNKIALFKWKAAEWKDCTIEVHKEKKVDETSDDDRGGRMDVCAEIKRGSKTVRRVRSKTVRRVIIENKIDSNLNGIDEDKKLSQLNTYYKQWGKKAAKEPLCLVVAPAHRLDVIKREIEKIDENPDEKINHNSKKEDNPKMGDRYLLVNYGDIADFIKQPRIRKELEKEIDGQFVEQFIASFREHSLTPQEYYAWLFWQALKKQEQAESNTGMAKPSAHHGRREQKS